MAKKQAKPKVEEVKIDKIEPKDLPREGRVALTHALKDFGMSVRGIATHLGFSKSSIQHYLAQELTPDWYDFSTQIKKAVMLKEEKLATQALKHIEEKMPKASFHNLVGFYKIIRELQGRGIVQSGGGGKSLHLHFHQSDKVRKIVRDAEDKVEQAIRDEIEQSGKETQPELSEVK